jgi:hypothetical protein
MPWKIHNINRNYHAYITLSVILTFIIVFLHVTLPKRETHTFSSSNFRSPYLNDPCTKSLQTRNLGHSTHFLGAYQLTARNFAFSISQIFGGWGGSIKHRRTLAHARLLGVLWEFLGMFFSISSRCSRVLNQYSLCFGP